jgi:hypothetical protein
MMHGPMNIKTADDLVTVSLYKKMCTKSSMVLISVLFPENKVEWVALIGLCFNTTELHTM